MKKNKYSKAVIDNMKSSIDSFDNCFGLGLGWFRKVEGAPYVSDKLGLDLDATIKLWKEIVDEDSNE